MNMDRMLVHLLFHMVFSYGYSYGGGWDIDTSERTQRESDGGHIPGRYQWEETVDVSGDN